MNGRSVADRPARAQFIDRTRGLFARGMEDAMEIDMVLNAYRVGDENKRLSLFLGYRDLRDQFEQIEEESEHEDFVIVFPWNRKHHFPRNRKHRLAHAA